MEVRLYGPPRKLPTFCRPNNICNGVRGVVNGVMGVIGVTVVDPPAPLVERAGESIPEPTLPSYFLEKKDDTPFM